jgi:uncharacterized protein (DUF1499 family)
MAHRRIVEIPKSRLAVWAYRLALFALSVAILGTLIVRTDLLEIVPALATVGGALVLAAAAILVAMAALVVIWREGFGGLGAAVGAIFIGLALLAYPGYLASIAYHLPALNDITTDPADPPRFEVAAQLRRPGSNPIAYPGPQAAAKQNAAYPDLETLVVSVTAQVAYKTIRAVIVKRKWLIVEERRPLPRRQEGYIEAVARTPIMGFRDDVAIRIRPVQDGTRIDVRSASRYGTLDFGANAARIVSLLDDIETEADALSGSGVAEPAQEPRPRSRR